MGAEFFKVAVDAKTEYDVCVAYDKVLDVLLNEKAWVEAEYYLDMLISGELEVEDNEAYKTALRLYEKDNNNEALRVLRKHLIDSHSEALYAYTGTFLSADYGIKFLDREFESEEDATTYIEETHQKWEMPMGAKIKDSDRWIVAGWCSS